MGSEAATRTLYFDIDGTVLRDEHQEIKSALGQGCFERAKREASFTELVCLGNFLANSCSRRKMSGGIPPVWGAVGT